MRCYLRLVFRLILTGKGQSMPIFKIEERQFKFLVCLPVAKTYDVFELLLGK